MAGALRSRLAIRNRRNLDASFGALLRRKNQRKSQGTAGRISSARNPPIGALPADRDAREMALCNDKNGTSIPPSAESA
jgi:hypothetical protein